jgi:selenoprotein W-related protein
LTERILGSFKGRVTSLELVPSSGGVFEVSRDGQALFSKKATGRFPEWEEIRDGLT